MPADAYQSDQSSSNQKQYWAVIGEFPRYGIADLTIILHLFLKFSGCESMIVMVEIAQPVIDNPVIKTTNMKINLYFFSFIFASVYFFWS